MESSSAAPNDTLRFEVIAPDTVRAGEPVDFVLRLTNVTERTIEVHLQGREPVFDLVVRNLTGLVVWRRLAGANNLAILALRPLAAGEAMEFRHSWDQRGAEGEIAPGEYTVSGELPSDAPVPLQTAPVVLRVIPRSRP